MMFIGKLNLQVRYKETDANFAEKKNLEIM